MVAMDLLRHGEFEEVPGSIVGLRPCITDRCGSVKYSPGVLLAETAHFSMGLLKKGRLHCCCKVGTHTHPEAHQWKPFTAEHESPQQLAADCGGREDEYEGSTSTSDTSTQAPPQDGIHKIFTTQSSHVDHMMNQSYTQTKYPMHSNIDPSQCASCNTAYHELLSLVRSQCGFLKIRGHGLHVEKCNVAKQYGVAMSVCIFVRGLPAAKRSRWHTPLLYTVAPLLQKHGWKVKVHRGNLYTFFEEEVGIRVVFAAARQ